MMYLLDTDTCVYWLRGHEKVRQQISAVEPDNLVISIISLAELHYGADCSNRPDHNHAVVDDFVNGLNVLALDPPTLVLSLSKGRGELCLPKHQAPPELGAGGRGRGASLGEGAPATNGG